MRSQRCSWKLSDDRTTVGKRISVRSTFKSHVWRLGFRMISRHESTIDLRWKLFRWWRSCGGGSGVSLVKCGIGHRWWKRWRIKCHVSRTVEDKIRFWVLLLVVVFCWAVWLWPNKKQQRKRKKKVTITTKIKEWTLLMDLVSVVGLCPFYKSNLGKRKKKGNHNNKVTERNNKMAEKVSCSDKVSLLL